MIPAILLGNLVGAIPGFSAANTIIILLPLTLSVDVEVALIFMMALYSASQLGNGIPAILVNIPGTGG
ncbi:tripartite tricarboxylate transporter permease, partial [Roseicyclus sp.]